MRARSWSLLVVALMRASGCSRDEEAATQAGGIGNVPTPALRRLIYRCSDEVTFAVRTFGDRLEVVPPGVASSYVVDCVSNPAAAVWGTVQPATR